MICGVILIVAAAIGKGPGKLLGKIASVFSWLLCLGAFIANCFFLDVIAPFSPSIVIAGGVFLGFWLLSNTIFTGLLLFQNIEGGFWRRLTLVLVSFLSLVDFGLLNVVTQAHQMIELLRLSHGFLQFLPLLVLQLVSFSMVAPIISLVALFFNSLGLGLLLITEVSRWLFSSQKAVIEEFELAEVLSSSSTPLNEKATTVGPSLFFLKFLTALSFPVVVISLIPQALTLLGLPFCLFVLKRLAVGFSYEDYQDKKLEPSWLDARGYSLLLVNIVSFLFAMIFLLPGITIAGLVLLVGHQLSTLCSRQSDSVWFPQFRHTIQSHMAILLFAYFPSLIPKIPEIQLPIIPVVNLSKEKTWKKLVGFSSAFVFVIILPVVDGVTSLVYAFNLLTISLDSFLTNRDILITWMIIGFFSAGFGIFTLLLRLLMEFVSICRSGFTTGKVMELAWSLSLFGHPGKVTMIRNIVALLSVLGRDLLQILVTCNTIGFVGIVDPLWGFKLALSLFSLSYNLGKHATTLVYGKKITAVSRTVLNFAFFFLFGAVFSLLVGFLTTDDYCALNRTIDTQQKLTAIAACTTLSGSVRFTGFQSSVSQEFSMTLTTSPTIEIYDNTAPVNLTFPSLVNGTANFTVTDNRAPLQLTFPLLEKMYSFTATGNWDLSLTAPAFTYTTVDLIIANNIMPALSFPALFAFQDMYLENNTFTTLNLPFLDINVGEIIIADNPEMDTIVFSLQSGEYVEFRNNSKLSYLDFAKLLDFSNLTIANNKALRKISLASILVADPMDFLIESNAALETIDLSNLESFGGYPIITGNPSLVNILLGNFVLPKAPGYMEISDNESLESLSFPSATCYGGVPPFLLLQNNPNLVNLTISSLCIPSIVAINDNANLTIYALEDPALVAAGEW